MELLGKIRRMHVRDKLSERAIAKRTLTLVRQLALCVNTSR